MKHSIPGTVYQLLRALKIQASARYLKEKLYTHPDFPSLASVTDTLQDMGIEHVALVTEKEKASEIPFPYLMHTSSNKGSFVLVKDQTTFRKHPELLKEWTGVILAAEKPEKIIHDENRKYRKEDQLHRLKLATGLAVLILAGLAAATYGFSFNTLLLQFTALTGVFVAALIVQHELGYSNTLVNKLCAVNKETDCEAVLQSNASKLPFTLQWSDIGIIYFTTLWLLLVMSQLMGQITNTKPLLAIISAASIPFTLFSVFYQWRIVKKWCMLCLLTIGILWFQLALQWQALYNIPTMKELVAPVTAAMLLLGIVSTIWLLLVKPLLLQNQENTTKVWSLTRFKRNPDILITTLQQQRRVDTTPFRYELQMGNPNAEIRLHVACSAFCKPCAEAHEVLHELMENNWESISLCVRFAVPDEQFNAKDLKVLEHIHQQIFSITAGQEEEDLRRRRCAQVLQEWFTIRDLEKIRKNTLPHTIDIEAAIKEHDHWASASKLLSTPTLFINGYELPPQYYISDLPLLILSLKEKAHVLNNHSQHLQLK